MYNKFKFKLFKLNKKLWFKLSYTIKDSFSLYNKLKLLNKSNK